MMASKTSQQIERAHLSSLLDGSSDGIALIDFASKKFVYANPAYVRLIGYTLEELQNLNSIDVLKRIHPDDRTRFLMEFYEIATEQTTHNESVYRFKRKDGVQIWLSDHRNLIYEKDVTTFIMGICRDVSKQFENEQLLKKTAAQDSLTGLLNRVNFEEVLRHEIAVATYHQSSLTLMMADLDHFKAVNDGYGHLVGDSVLVETAELMRRSIRSSDYLFRVGGEEFVFVLPQTSLMEGMERAERIRITIESYSFEKVGQVTCSIGVAQYIPHQSQHEWYQRVDKALYEAKRDGRNRVHAAI